jgi:hypothetical protein
VAMAKTISTVRFFRFGVALMMAVNLRVKLLQHDVVATIVGQTMTSDDGERKLSPSGRSAKHSESFGRINQLAAGTRSQYAVVATEPPRVPKSSM